MHWKHTRIYLVFNFWWTENALFPAKTIINELENLNDMWSGFKSSETIDRMFFPEKNIASFLSWVRNRLSICSPIMIHLITHRSMTSNLSMSYSFDVQYVCFSINVRIHKVKSVWKNAFLKKWEIGSMLRYVTDYCHSKYFPLIGKAWYSIYLSISVLFDLSISVSFVLFFFLS